MRALFLTLFFFPSLSWSQTFQLPEIDVDKLISEYYSTDETAIKEPPLIYLLKHFTPTRERDCDSDTLDACCGYTQEFQEGIEYAYYACWDVGEVGEEHTLILPRVATENMRQWIEQMAEVIGSDPEDYFWEDDYNYSPHLGVGCSFSFGQYEDTTEVSIYCGC
ncbi:MAG TPA: hypothetical protein DCE41_06015 [Cytophagales bacterium]|nr:hypothetical protein [Cytophagales bacterium]HAA19097.1 hypothetical protein [Cytophagales bacterium]HAP63827.1 hypothetical protein [Cytophagales bacterium]